MTTRRKPAASDASAASTAPVEPAAAATNDSPAAAAFQQVWATQVDSQTAQQLTGLVHIRQARVNLLQRTVTQLTATQGAASSEVAALQQKIADQQSFTAALGVVRDQSATPAPVVPAGGWVIYGTIRDQNLQPLPMLTVALADQQKDWLRDYGYAFTDASGNFSLSYTPSPNAAVPQSALSAFLQVTNQNRQPIYLDATAFTVSSGATLYRNVVLPATTVLGAPPAGAAPAPPGTPVKASSTSAKSAQ